MAATTTTTAETTFGCDLLARPSLCTGTADTVVTTRSGLAFSCRACADDHAELAAATAPNPTEAPF